MFLQLFCFFVLVVFLKQYFSEQNSRFPPGPLRLPVIGSLLSVLWADANLPYLAFSKLSKKYGPIVGLQMGSVRTVAISGAEMLNRVANSEDLLARIDETDLWLLEKTESVPLGLVFSLPEAWTRTRAFSAKNLRQYGITGVTESSHFILEEIADHCNDLKAKMTNGQVVMTMSDQFNTIFFNIVWRFITGNKYGMNPNMSRMLKHSTEDFIRASKFTGSIVQIFPQLLPIFPALIGFNQLKAKCETWRKNIRTVINEARQDGSFKTNPDNFLENFLLKADTTQRSQNLQDNIFTEENLIATCQDFPLGGMDTQSSAMKLFVRFIIENPDVQEKLHVEVTRVVGNSRLVSLDDLPNLPYVHATLQELLRLGNMVPLIPRKLLKNWKIDNYVIPKGTLVILNIWSGDNDETVYKDASKFLPSRFLTEDGKFLTSDKLHVFGYGKRRCIAEQLSKTWLPLLMTSLVQNFSFHVDPDFGTKWGPDIIGLTRCPAPFNVIIKAREM